MKRLAIAALTAVCTLACAPASAQPPADFSAIDAKLKTCSEKNPSIPGSANCTLAAIAAANRRLNEIYAAVVDALKHPGPSHAPYNPEIVKRLIVAERAWIAFRDAECNYKSTIALGAPLEGPEYVDCLYAQTKARAKTLTAPDAPQNARK